MVRPALPAPLAALAASRATPPRPPGRAGPARLLRHLALMRADMLTAQSERLFDAWMAEFRAPFFHSVVLNQPDLVHWVLSGADGAVVKARRSRAALVPLLGRSAFVAEGAAWEAARAGFDAAFRPVRGQGALGAVAAAGDGLLADLRARGNGPVDAAAAAARAALDVILRLTYGRPPVRDEIDGLLDALARFRAAAPLTSPGAVVPALGFAGLGAAPAARRAARDLHAVIAGAGAPGPDSIAARLRARHGPRDAAGQTALTLVAGHEGVAASLGWALFLLASTGEVQDRVAAEGAALPAAPGPADLARLTATRNVVRETLRLYPPLPVIAREALRPLTLRGRNLPRGALIAISPWHLHRHRRLWAAPDAFLPERWALTGADGPPRAAFQPFATGPRGCPGGGLAMLALVALVARVAGALRLAPCAARPPVPVARMTLRAADGIWLTMAPRAPARAGIAAR